jgi:hypothetical protein
MCRPKYSTGTTPERATRVLAKRISKRPKDESTGTMKRMPRRRKLPPMATLTSYVKGMNAIYLDGVAHRIVVLLS